MDYTAIQALGAALQHETPSALQGLERAHLDLERARMTAEDFRQGNGPCSGFRRERDGPTEWASWRECLDSVEEGHTVALDALSNIRNRVHDMDGHLPMGVVADAVEQIKIEVDAVLGEESDDEA